MPLRPLGEQGGSGLAYSLTEGCAGPGAATPPFALALGVVGSLRGRWIFLAPGVSAGAALVSLIVVVPIGADMLIEPHRLFWSVPAQGRTPRSHKRRVLSVWARRRGGEEMKRKVSRMRIGVLLCCLVAIFLAGCATARGLGQDTQSLGRSIEEKAQ